MVALVGHLSWHFAKISAALGLGKANELQAFYKNSLSCSLGCHLNS